jgi:V/A-type H+-transporting ATPase subunit D
MSLRSVPPTRSGLLQASARLQRVRRGRQLINRKREALIAELFRSARPALDARRQVEERASLAYRTLLDALASRGEASLRTYGWPSRDILVELEQRQIWGISIPELVAHSEVQRTLTSRESAAPSIGPAAAESALEFERLVALLLESLPKEQAMRRLGAALHKATRQVNTLELRVEPSLSAELGGLRRMLEERERDERSRLRHVLRRRRKRGA